MKSIIKIRKSLIKLILVSLSSISFVHAETIEPSSASAKSDFKLKSSQDKPTKPATTTASIENISVAKRAEMRFENVIAHIDSTLLKEQKQLKTDRKLLEHFVDSNILSNWDSQRTLKHLLGKKIWKTLTDSNLKSLNRVFEDTLQRYVREGMGHYDGQRVKLVSVRLNKKKIHGVLTIRLEPIYLPAFKVSFRIASKNDQWKLYDVLVEGISYVKTKKNEYRRMVREKGIDGLLAHLDAKNRL